MIQTSDGGFALAGTSNTNTVGESDVWLVKLDANGQHEWEATFGGMEGDEARSLIQTSDGGFTLAGTTNINTGGDGTMWLVKTDANGQHEWNRTCGKGNTGRAYSLIETSDGGLALAGVYNGYRSGTSMWLEKTNATGHMEWYARYGGKLDREFSTSACAYSLIQTSDDGFALVGIIHYDNGNVNMLLIKADTTGNKEWEVSFGGAEQENARSVVQTSDGGFICTGLTRSFNVDDSATCLVKVNSIGTIEWYTTFEGTDYDGAYTLIQTSDEGFVLAGYNKGYNKVTGIWLMKIDRMTVLNTMKLTPSWTPIIVIIPLIVIVVRKKMKHSKVAAI